MLLLRDCTAMKKVMDIIPPFGWNWTDDDWRMYNFFRDLDSHGGVVSGGLFDRYVLLQYDKQHPAKSLIIVEKVWKIDPMSMQAAAIAMQNFSKALKHVNCRSMWIGIDPAKPGADKSAHYTIEGNKITQNVPDDHVAWKKGA